MEGKMPSRKTSKSSKGSAKKTGKAAAASIKGGAVPPYGIGIREAVARGDSQEMRKVAASSHRYLKTIHAALDELEKAISKKSS